MASVHQIDTVLLVTPALRINTKHNTTAPCTECTPLLPSRRSIVRSRTGINYALLSLGTLLFAGIIVGSYLLVQDNRAIDVKLVFDMVDRIELDSNVFPLGPDLVSSNVQNIYIMQTNGFDCHSNTDCVAVVRNMQITAMTTDNSSLPYNFLVGGDGETYEIRGWSEQSGFSFVPQNSSLTIGIIGSFNKHSPPDEQLTETYALISESLRRRKITEPYRIYGVRNSSISATNSEALLRCISKWDHWMSTVKHSYRINQKPLKCWIATDRDGIILSGHCDCMAGLGEVCSHIGALLFLLEHWARLSDNMDRPDEVSCTDVLAKWVAPSTKQVEMASVENINESTNQSILSLENITWTLRNSSSQDIPLNDTAVISIDSSIDVSMFFSDTITESEQIASTGSVDSESNVSEEIDKFLQRIRDKGIFCSLMALREPFSNHFIEKSAQELLDELPSDEDVHTLSHKSILLSSLYNASYEGLSLEDLRKIGSQVQLTYTDDEINFIEMRTKEQSSCKLWYKFRIGRVTGSTFKKVCRTSTLTPSLSTIRLICYPEQCIFKSIQTNYGSENEPVARNCYAEIMRREHTNFLIRESGLIINNSFPFCGASPDALVSCDCCGCGTLEIKCPWLLRYGNINAYLKKRECPLLLVDGDNEKSWTYKLKEQHEYYYQIQMQMFLSNSEYCDFVIWLPTTKNPTIKIRVYKDELFWFDAYAKASAFFEKVLLPELLGCYYTQKK